jgi:hypothetical protein
MTDPYRAERGALIAAVTAGEGDLASALRRAILDRARRLPTPTPIPSKLASFVDLVAEHASSIDDANVDALRSEWAEEAIFETIVATAVGASLVRLERVDALLTPKS